MSCGNNVLKMGLDRSCPFLEVEARCLWWLGREGPAKVKTGKLVKVLIQKAL